MTYRPLASSLAPLTLLLITLAGCGGWGGQSDRPRLVRFIEEQPRALLDVEELLIKEPISGWSFPLADDPALGWTRPDRGAVPIADGLRLEAPAGKKVVIWRQVDLAASEADTLRVTTTLQEGGSLSLLWAGPGESFSPQRRVEAKPIGNDDAGDPVSLFEVRGHSLWRGPIERLRLDYQVVHRQNGAIELRSLRAYRHSLDRERTTLVSGDPWRVDLGRERRDGLVAISGRPISWSVDEPSRWRLRFGYGTRPMGDGAVIFRVRTDAPPPADRLFEVRVGDGGRAPGRWYEGAVDLSDLPRETTLEFEVEARTRSGGEGRGLALWSNPELVALDAPDERPNIALISIDTLRPDHLSLYGYSRITSANLDRWAQQAVVFEKAVTTAPWTLPAHVSLFSGLDALHHGVNHKGRVPDDLRLLAQDLRAAGYATLAVTGGGFVHPDYGLGLGFDRYRYLADRSAEGELTGGIRQAMQWLNESPHRPFFLFFHTYEVHHPYRARQPYFQRYSGAPENPLERSLGYVSLPQRPESGFMLTKEWSIRTSPRETVPLSASQRELLVDLYDSGVAYADEHVGRLLSRLDIEAATDDTVIVVTSDHGEALGEKGLAGHAYVEDFNALVPLILRLPSGESGRIETQVRVTDIAPTLLELAGIDVPPTLDGTSLLPLIAGSDDSHRPGWIYAASSNRGIALRLQDRLKYIFNNSLWAPINGREQFYDLRQEPEELVEFVPESAQIEGLRRLVREELTTGRRALAVHLENRSTSRVRGRLFGRLIQPLKIKSPNLPRGGLTLGIPGNIVTLDVDAGESVDLFLENPREGALEIDLDPGFRAAVRPSDLTAEWSASLTDDGWRLSLDDGAAGVQAVLSIGWTTESATTTSDPADEDPELRRQLEALGYID